MHAQPSFNSYQLKANLAFSIPHPLVRDLHQMCYQPFPLRSMIPLVFQDFSFCVRGSHCYWVCCFSWQSRKTVFCLDFEHQIHCKFILLLQLKFKNSEFLVNVFYFISVCPFSPAKNSCVRKIRGDKIILSQKLCIYFIQHYTRNSPQNQHYHHHYYYWWQVIYFLCSSIGS